MKKNAGFWRGLQFFADSEPAPTPAPVPETSPEKTFTQAEVDSIVGKRFAKAMKGMPGEYELKDFLALNESQQTEKERWDTLTRERDESKTALTAAQAELEQYKREKFLLGKGVPAADVDYYAFKIGKLVTDTKDFEAAADEYLAEHAPQQQPESPPSRIRVDFSAPLGGGSPNPPSLNDYINNRLRGR